MSVLAIPTGGARVDQICRVLDGLSKLTAEEFERALPDLGDFIRVVDALIGHDDLWQRRFKHEIVSALTKVPGEHNELVPTRFMLRTLHECVARCGAKDAIAYLEVTSPCPTWIDLCRVYRGEGFKRVSAGTRERQMRKRADLAQTKARSRRQTVMDLRCELRGLREIVGRYQHILDECERRGVHDNELVPRDLWQPGTARVEAQE